jgi:hypothetical protein
MYKTIDIDKVYITNSPDFYAFDINMFWLYLIVVKIHY